jgi:hypothetical protein
MKIDFLWRTKRIVRERKIATKESNEPGQQRKRTENRRTMCQKDATCENTERAQGTEKQTAKVNDGKHIRKSRKSQKGGNEHKKSKNFECTAESKAREQPKPTTERAEQEQGRAKHGRPKPEEGEKQFPGTRSLFSARKSFGRWEIKRHASRRSHFD